MAKQITLVWVLLAGTAPALFLQSANAQQPCLKKAWEAFNQTNYQQALDAAGDCVDQFSARAFRDEHALEAAKEKQPPNGVVENDFDKRHIFDRGVLNDVATSYYIRGRAAEQISKKSSGLRARQIAIESYKGAVKLPYGRCWDPEGWFWSPAEASSDRLAALK